MRNHLGIDLGDDPVEILRRLDLGRIDDTAIGCDDRSASAAADYAELVREIDAPTPARFNADPRRLFEAAGSGGKLLVFAVRLDTFAAARTSTVFYIGTNDTAEFTLLRRRLLSECPELPVSGEYIHREAFDLAAGYGKDMVLAIRWLGTRRLPRLFAFKARLDRWAAAARVLPVRFADRLLHGASKLFPQHLPRRMLEFRNRFEHHLIVKAADDAIEPVRAFLDEMFPSKSGAMFECDKAEAEAAMLHRFAVAGAAVRYRNLFADRIEDVVAIDIALRRDEHDWFETLPEDISQHIVTKLYYGHFLCHVFHQDYLVKKGVNPHALEQRILRLVDARGGEYPAEHNVGHLYEAKPTLAAHYRDLDPGNRMNPGIGGLSKLADYV